MDKHFSVQFTQCPNCASPLQFLNELTKELKDRGMARPQFQMRYDNRQGPVFDERMTTIMPIGISLPGYRVVTDICMDCGTIYAVELTRLEGHTSAATPSAPDLLGRSN